MFRLCNTLCLPFTLSLFLADLENSQASKRYVMPARTGDTSLKLTFLNCQHLTCSPSLFLTTSRTVSLYRSHFVSPSAFLHIDFDTWQSFIVVVVVAAVNMSSWLVCPTSLTASQPGPWTMSWVDLPHEQYAARNVQLSVSSEWQLQQKL